MLRQLINTGKEIPLTTQDILNICPDARVLLYEQLATVRSIYDVLSEDKPIVLLYQTVSREDGHWIAITTVDGIVYYFDSYGNDVDYYPNVTTQNKYLSRLLYNSRVTLDVNNIDYQIKKAGVNNCGRYAAARSYFCNLSNEEFNTMLSQKIALQSPDDIVTMITLI